MATGASALNAPPRSRSLLRIALWSAGVLVATLVVAAAGLLVAFSVFDSPTYAWRIVVYGESDTGDVAIFPSRPIAAADAPSPLPSAPGPMPETITYPYGQGTRSESLNELLARTDTKAFIVVRDDHVVFEDYPGSTRDAVNTSFSSAKSFDSAMIGAAIADGFIRSVDDPVIRYVPELGGRGFDVLTIRDLLMMSSGIRYIGNDEQPFYMSPFGDDTRTYYSADMRRTALSVTASDAPVGAHFRYNNYHPLIEGLIIERATGMPVAKYLEQRIWQPMGAEFPASWSLDSEQSGFEKMESGLNVRAIDFARFGLLFLHEGYWNGRQILPADWVREATSPLRPDPRVWEVFTQWPTRGGFYKYHWWGLNNPDGTYDFMARGAYDQYIYVAPRKNAVIVRMGNKPDTGMEWGLVLHAIVDALP